MDNEAEPAPLHRNLSWEQTVEVCMALWEGVEHLSDADQAAIDRLAKECFGQGYERGYERGQQRAPRDCAHSWTPWLQLPNASFWCRCVECDHQEQYDWPPPPPFKAVKEAK